jgi:23S rRNA (adenine2503-C2)-methyltransferase
MKPSVYSFTAENWKQHVPGGALNYWLEGLRGKKEIWDKHLSPPLLHELKKYFSFDLPEISRVQEASDGTVKFLVRFADLMEVETVAIPFHESFTICLSTQVGCAMNCSFCYTGTQGLKRHLKSSEIVGQYLVVHQWLKKNERSKSFPNIVFMGQGEPLHNADEVHQAIKVLSDPLVVGVGHRQFTLSTVGHLPGLKKILEFPRINLAFSLHSPFPEERVKLIPVEATFGLHEVLKALDEIPLRKRQYIAFEYILIKDFNMSERHADELQKLLSPRRAFMNLIPFNPFPGSNWKRPSADEIEAFRKLLVERKIRVMVRTTKGDEILAACGQLKINKLSSL